MVRQTVRALAAKPLASAILVIAMMIGAAVVVIATSEDEPAPYTSVDTVADRGAPTTLTDAPTPQEDRGAGLAGAVAGFGIISVWLVGLGIGLHRARRRRTMQDTTTTDEAPTS